jgi:hypothetical protein
LTITLSQRLTCREGEKEEGREGGREGHSCVEMRKSGRGKGFKGGTRNEREMRGGGTGSVLVNEEEARER